MAKLVLALALLSTASALSAKDSLGVYSSWAAFRDPGTPNYAGRCYAIAKPHRAADAFASVGTWPGEGVRGQVHVRLSREARSAQLTIGGTRFELVAMGRDAWAADAGRDAAILAAMRSAETMRVTGRTAGGGLFSDRYSLEGAATAMDAAVVGCAGQS
ncbi:MAG: hypothetical protein AAF127_03530 [Pseudomonadota bacterium]